MTAWKAGELMFKRSNKLKQGVKIPRENFKLLANEHLVQHIGAACTSQTRGRGFQSHLLIFFQLLRGVSSKDPLHKDAFPLTFS